VIDRDSPLPIYYQLKTLIKRQIEGGQLEAGNRLPTERTLCERYSISRTPVRQALTELVHEGYIYRRPGQGTFVSAREATAESITTLQLFAYDVLWVTLLERTVSQWNELHPQRRVRLEINMPPRADFHRAFRAAVARGDAPDLVSLDYVWITHYARLGYLMPIDALAPNFYLELEEELERAVLRNNLVDGHLYGVPAQTDVTGLWYRRDWFELEGVRPPESWDQWLEVLAHFGRDDVKARLGHQHPVAFPVGTGTGEATLNLLIPFVWAAGGRLVDAVGHFTGDPAVYRALDFLRQITWEGRWLPEDARTFAWWDPPRRLSRGEVAMTLGGTYEWPVMVEESVGNDATELARRLAFAPIPRPASRVPLVSSLGGTTWSILRQSQHQDLSMELLELALSPSLVRDFCLESQQLASLRYINRELMEANGLLRAAVPLLDHARPRPMLAEYVRVSRFLQQMFEHVLWEGMSVEDATTRAARALELLQV
jgi:ABC-type glycerol-3-phosphate transport system substrate-binding protein